jgi:hypothetical protein
VTAILFVSTRHEIHIYQVVVYVTSIKSICEKWYSINRNYNVYKKCHIMFWKSRPPNSPNQEICCMLILRITWFHPGFSGVRVVQSLVFCVVFYRSLFAFLSLHCLSFFDIRSCLPIVGGSLRVLRLFPPLKLVAMI